MRMHENKYRIKVEHEGLGSYLINMELVDDIKSKLPKSQEDPADADGLDAIMIEAGLTGAFNNDFLRIGFIDSCDNGYFIRRSSEFKDGKIFILSPKHDVRKGDNIIKHTMEYNKIEVEHPITDYDFSSQSIIRIYHEGFGIDSLLYYDHHSKRFEILDFSSENINNIVTMNLYDAIRKGKGAFHKIPRKN